MPGRARGRMFDIQPEHDDDSGTGSYPGYPGYGDDGDLPDDAPGRGGHRNGAAANGSANGSAMNGAANGSVVNGRAANGAAANGSGGGASRNGGGRGRAPRGGAVGGARPGARPGTPGGEAATTAVRPVRGATGATPAPGAPRRDRLDDRDARVAPDGRWDSDEPPLLSHRSDEPAYARDHTPQGFDGGDPDDPAWGRRNGHRPGSADGYGPDDYYDDEYDDDYDDEDTPAPRGPDDGYDADDHDDGDDPGDGYDEDEYGVGDAPLSVPPPGSNGRPLGPADVEELDPSMTDALARVDLGSVQVPVPYGAEMKLEPSTGERPQAVHLLLPEGRIAVSALAAPRSSGLWPDLAAEIEASLRKGGARVRNAQGDWGRELHARTENAASVFVGCDGPRWMVYGVATASLETVDALDVELRRVLRGIIVVRGKSPYPPRTVLPLDLPERLREEQPDAAPAKASITVSVPAPTPDDDAPADDDAAAPAATTGTPRGRPGGPSTGTPTTATPAAPGGSSTGGTRRPGRPTPVGPPARRPAEQADPATRALPQVRRPAAGPPAPTESPAERTAVAGPAERPAERTAVAGPPVRPAGAAGRAAAARSGAAPSDAARSGDEAVHHRPDRAIAPGRTRPGRPDRPARQRRDADPAGSGPGAGRPTGAQPVAPPERGTGAARRPAASRDPLGAPSSSGTGHDDHVPTARFAPDRLRDDRFADHAGSEDRVADHRYPDDGYRDDRSRDDRYLDDRSRDDRYLDDRSRDDGPARTRPRAAGLADDRYADDRYGDDRYADDGHAAAPYSADPYSADRYPDDRPARTRSRRDRTADDRFAEDRYPEDRYPDERRGRSRPPAADRAPAAPPEPAPSGVPEPPVRRDPAVTALSAADLLAGTPADPATRDRSVGAEAAGFGTGAGTGASGRPARRRADRANGDGDTPRDGYDLGPRRRPAPDRPDPAVSLDPVASFDPAAALDRDERSTMPERDPEPVGPLAIEDIPLADIPLMEAALDPALAPAPVPPAPSETFRPAPSTPATPDAGGAALPRRRRRDRAADAPPPGAPDGDHGPTGRPAGTDESGWLSAEIAATRRSGRHGAGTGAGWSVADILASAGVGDPPRPTHRGPDPTAGPHGDPGGRPADPAANGAGDHRGIPVPGGDDLFRSPAEAGERYRDTPGRRERRHGAPGGADPGDHRRNGHTPAPGAHTEDPDGRADDHAGGRADRRRDGGAPANGHAVTGLADYRRSRRAAADRDPARPGDDVLDPPEPGGDPGTGRAAGGSGLTGQWSSGRRHAGTDPEDLGRHRRD